MNVGDPIPHRFADGVLKRLAAIGDPDHFRSQQAHAKHVELLAAHVLNAHVDDAFEPKQRADGGGGHAVLPRAGFGNDALLAHAAGEKSLPQAVVDLVRAGVQQVFALEINFRAAEHFAQALGVVERRGTAGVVVQQIGQFGLKRRVGCSLVIGVLEFFERRHQHFGHESSAVGSEMSGGVGLGCYHVASRAAFTKARTLS